MKDAKKGNGMLIFSIVAIIGLAASGAYYFLMVYEPPIKHLPPKFRTNLGDDYGYDGKLNQIRDKDMKHLNGSIYLDYAGSGLYRTSQIEGVFNTYKHNLFANPHSLSPASALTTELVEETRDRILKFLGTTSSEYTVIFTASCTASLRLLAESFPWSSKSLYLYTRDNHNSVLGVRRWATHFGATFRMANEEELQGQGNRKQDSSSVASHLFAYPLEENFAGKKYPQEWVRKFKTTDFPDKFAKGNWYVLLDASAYLPTNELNLHKVQADFVVMSFYKIFGFPNLGALVVKNDVVPNLRKMGFAGGSVVMATCGKDFALLQPRGCSRFEDGTIPFLSILALKNGFDALDALGIKNISKHTWCVARELYVRLNNIRHSNGRPVVKIYGNHNLNDPLKQGPIITLNFLNSTGGYIGYNEVMKNAAKENINIRVGCFCNPGGCTKANGLTDDEVEEYYKEKTSCHDSIDIVNGVPLGAVRISMGAYTSMEDVEAFTNFVEKYFVH
ncbi:molybdenum cofactor sulfurase [Histomonas meleagridis]|uniref:molybdenum cofactor sulfurase n=1 Tax=Histomonas meleagridis TaxID=135588 RepID=UPI00355A8CAE|nr:molybdenum cofactor sulfurase [Histomonas meleagridis]KAH0806033.1 molybdenum cofactor sulfurase [Histomonas meleagridis]